MRRRVLTLCMIVFMLIGVIVPVSAAGTTNTGTITFAVKDADGNPLSGITMSLLGEKYIGGVSQGYVSLNTATTGADGKAVIQLNFNNGKFNDFTLTNGSRFKFTASQNGSEKTISTWDIGTKGNVEKTGTGFRYEYNSDAYKTYLPDFSCTVNVTVTDSSTTVTPEPDQPTTGTGKIHYQVYVWDYQNDCGTNTPVNGLDFYLETYKTGTGGAHTKLTQTVTTDENGQATFTLTAADLAALTAGYVIDTSPVTTDTAIYNGTEAYFNWYWKTADVGANGVRKMTACTNIDDDKINPNHVALLTKDALEKGFEFTFVCYVTPSCTVNYNANGGTLTGAASETFVPSSTKTMFNKPADPTWDGHTFLGWYESENATEPFNFNATVTKSVDLIAKWSLDTVYHTVTWNTEDGYPLESASVAEDASFAAMIPTVPEKTGHTGKWTLTSGTPGENNTMGTTDLVYTATYTRNEYSLTLNANGGYFTTSTHPTTQVFTPKFGDVLDLTDTKYPVPTRLYYNFLGWATTANAGDADVLTSFTVPAESTTLYAVWERKMTHVTFSANGGKIKSSTITGKNDAIKLLRPVGDKIYDSETGYYIYNTNIEGVFITYWTMTRDGYNFLGWSTNKDATAADDLSSATVPEGDVTYYAVWERKVVQVIFNFNGGAVNTMSDGDPVSLGSIATAIPVGNEIYNSETGKYIYEESVLSSFDSWEITRENYRFLGWSKDSDATAAEANITVTEQFDGDGNAKSLTLYAVWERKTATVKFSPNGGKITSASSTGGGVSYEGDSNVTIDLTGCPVGDKIYDSETGKYIYNAWNGATRTWTMTRDGYNFLGWSTNKDATAADDLSSATVPESGVTYYAIWKQKTVTVMFSPNGGAITITDSDDIYGPYTGEIICPGIPVNAKLYNSTTGKYIYEDLGITFALTRDGYRFLGWSEDSDATAAEFDITVTESFGDDAIDLYAVWAPEYTIRWVNDGNTFYEVKGKLYSEWENNEYTGPMTLPTKKSDAEFSYVFTGWSEADIDEEKRLIIYTALYEWIPRSYTVTFVNYDGAVLYTENFAYNEVPTYGGETPTRAPEDDYVFTFAGWSPEISAVTGEATYTATYTQTLVCTHETDFYGVCAEPNCTHPIGCICNPDPTRGVRTLTIQTKNDKWELTGHVPFTVWMNPNTGWDVDHEIIYKGFTNEDGMAEIPTDVLETIPGGVSIYVTVGNDLENEFDPDANWTWAWDDLNYGKLRMVKGVANVKCVLDTAKNEYAFICARDASIGFTTNITIFVRNIEKNPVASEAKGTIHFNVYDEKGNPIVDPTNIVMNLNLRYGGKVYNLGSTAIITSTGTIELNAEALSRLPVGAVIDCDPAVGHWEWALGRRDIVRTIVVSGIAQGTNVNGDAVVTAESRTNGFEITFNCYLVSKDAEPVAPSAKVNFEIINAKTGATVDDGDMILNIRHTNGTVTQVSASELTLSMLRVGDVIDCDPTGNYQWAISMQKVVRTMTVQSGSIAYSANYNQSATVTAASLENGFAITFQCYVIPKA